MHHTNTPIEDTYYWGTRLITKDQYELIKMKYDGNDQTVHTTSMPNEMILEMNQRTNKELEDILSQ